MDSAHLKRASPYSNDLAPPSKKHAGSLNGSSRKTDADWEEKVEEFQIDAIRRQKDEYKRHVERLTFDLNNLRKKTKHHDAHIRTIDAWFKQMLDEIKLMISSDEDVSMDLSSCPTSLYFADQETFQQHLPKWRSEIESVVSGLYSRRNAAWTPELIDLQNRLNQILAAQKEYIAQVQAHDVEKEDLDTRLETATGRYMKAEKKLDRVTSAIVQKMENQASTSVTKTKEEADAGTPNGVVDHSENVTELEDQLSKATAISLAQKEQLEKLAENNLKLTTQLTEAAAKSTEVTDDDFAKTDLFKQEKAQIEEQIKRINDLEAQNILLQKEAVQLQSERTGYKAQLDLESRAAISEKEHLLGQSDSNLARIRSSRDEILADHAIKKAQLESEWETLKKTQELSEARAERIKTLESENERLSAQPESMMIDSSELDTLSVEDLQARYAELERKYTLLNGELSSMSTAYSKTSKIANQKVGEYSALEERAQRLSQEKAKADQKFFAAMKSKETREGEVRILRQQNLKSSEMVSQLKESEAASRALVANLEKQLAELKDAFATKTAEHRTCQLQVTTHGHDIKTLNTQITELKKQLAEKDTNHASVAAACRMAEQGIEELKASVKSAKRSEGNWKSKAISSQTDQVSDLRKFIYCNVCNRDVKDTVLKSCGHTFCNTCLEDRYNNRMRKCPTCMQSFSTGDFLKMKL